MRTRIAAVLASAILAACTFGPFKGLGPQPGDADLSLGIRNYENADYPVAAKNLQDALNAGLSRVDQVTAHKYLAFIHCVSQRQKQCQDEFRKALQLDPQLDLSPAESGHPLWGPVFKIVKAEEKARK